MARKVSYVLTGTKDSVTGAEYATMEVEVKGKACPGRKRIFTSVEQVGSLPDDELLKMCNYAEDLWARAKVTSDNTPKGEKEASRNAAMKAWKLADAQGLFEVLGTPEMKASLDAYFTANEVECRKFMV